MGWDNPPIPWAELAKATVRKGRALIRFDEIGTPLAAFQLTGGTLPLATLVISSQISGDVLHNPGLGYAVAMTMVGIMAASIAIYSFLQRRSERWLRR